MSINLTYFKDCVFAIVTFCNYFGMLWANFQYTSKKYIDPVYGSTSAHYNEWQYTMEPALSNEEEDTWKIRVAKNADDTVNWLYGMMACTTVWIIVTLVTDCKSVFYRKAVVYRRMV